MNPDNDVHSTTFQSKLDPYFTAGCKMDRWGKYSRWDRNEARSLLSLHKPNGPEISLPKGEQ